MDQCSTKILNLKVERASLEPFLYPGALHSMLRIYQSWAKDLRNMNKPFQFLVMEINLSD